MKQLYSARNGLEAHDLRLFLEAHGVEAMVFGDNNALESVFAFTPGSAPGVWVGEDDLQRAAHLLEEFRNQPAVQRGKGKWICAKCGAAVERHFEVCWQCESVWEGAVVEPTSMETGNEIADDSQASPAEDRLDPEVVIPVAIIDHDAREVDHNLWFAVGAILAIAWFPYFASCYFYLAFPESSSDWSFAAESIWQVINQLAIIAVVLYVIYRDGRSWPTFGITRPRWFFDPAVAVAILIGSYVALDALYIMGAQLYGNAEMERVSNSTYEFSSAAGGVDLVVLVLVSLSIGFGEELVMRGYLIPTFEYLLKSTSKSILVTATLFASYHLYQGVGAAVWIFFLGIIFGGIFCWLRRLWPLALAHAAMDVIAMWPTAE